VPEGQHELVVVGAGPGGYVAALRAAQLGLDVACIDKESALGGTCLRVGCIPSKALLESSEHFVQARNQLARHGVRCGQVELDLPALLKRKDQVVTALTKGVAGLLKKNKITTYVGAAQLTGQGRLRVDSKEGTTELTAKNIILATGSKPAALRGVDFDGDRIGSSTEALSYPEVPRRLIVIGAGYIGIELGSVWHRLGAEVTVLEYLDRILPGMDTELAGEAKKVFEKHGLRFELGARVTSGRGRSRCRSGRRRPR